MSLYHNVGNGRFEDVTKQAGLDPVAHAIACTVGDYDNDGFADLAVSSSGRVGLLHNERNGTFKDVTEATGIKSGHSNLGLTFVDYDHDGDLDLYLTNVLHDEDSRMIEGDETQSTAMWRNNADGTFTNVTAQLGLDSRIDGVAAIGTDYNNDRAVDLIVGQAIFPPKIYENPREGKFLQLELWPKDAGIAVGLAVSDFNHDGWMDLALTQLQGLLFPAVTLWRNNHGGNKNNWLRLNLKGLADNKSAIETKVEVFSDGIRQKFEIYGSNGYLGQNSPYLTVGLGQAKEADIVRMLWPSGVLQDEIEVAANKEHKFLEMDRRGSSCPTLFAWGGEKYQLVADMLGDGVVGHWVGPGQRNIPRPTEYVKIDRNMLHEKDDSHFSRNRGEVGHPVFSFRFMEPLEEVVYLDKVGLLAVDHPADFDVFPNEYFASNPPFPEFKLVFSRDARPPAGAWDEHGHNVLPDILGHRYFGDFEMTSFKGFAKLHSLELDLGDPYRGGPLWLLMHGEIEYFTATGMYAADQAGIQGIAPYVEVLGPDGRWKKVIDDLGFPAGGARTMTADLSGKLRVGTKRIRITTNLQIYWDNILISRTPQNQKARLTSVPLTRADLRFHGFPLKTEGDPPGNVKYVYEEASATGPYTRPVGAYTRYGDVRPLLSSFDDRFVVFGSGDEVALDFDPSKLPPTPKGWVRDYFFVANGYEKDMDFYAAQGDTVDPLPFRSMGTYPYGAGKSFPLDEAHLNDLLNYDTRHLSGNEPRGYSFNYPK